MKRLVSYYDESQTDTDRNKYVYNRVGDFPIVHLRKNEIKRNLVRSSSVRIAPPNKTIMNRDIRAAILRSNSFQLGSSVPKLMPTKMRAKDDSHQIITNHDPLPIHESPQSAKSVLDALEKNCRKRINNEELTLDRNKRICATSAPQEVVDAGSTREFIPIAPQSVKRGREQVSPIKNIGDSPYAQMRKRSRTRNNALLSSLSSSQFILKPFNSSPSPSLSFSVPVPATQTSKAIDESTEKQFKEVSISSEKRISETPPKPETGVKRLHLFNAKVDASAFRTKVVHNDDNEPKINFIKPREKAPSSDVNIRQVEKEKLSMMLSGLSDGFLSPTKDYAKDSVDSVPASISFTTSTTTSTAGPITTPASSLSVSFAPSVKATETEKAIVLPAEPTTVVSKTPEDPATKPMPVRFQFGSSAPSTATVTTFSDVPTLINPTVVPTTTMSQQRATGRVSPLALFTSPGEAKPTPTLSVDQSQPLISFTPNAKSLTDLSAAAPATSVNPLPTASLASTMSTLTGGFTLGGSKEPEKTQSSFSFGGNSISSGFGSSSTLTSLQSNTAVTTASSLLTAANPSLSFNTPPKPAFSFGGKPAISATAVAPGTGLASSISGIAPMPSNLGGLGSTVSFIQKPATTTASGIGFSFSNTQSSTSTLVPATTASSGFSFGSSQSVMSPSNQMSAAPVVTTASSFSFGSSNSSGFGQPQPQPAAAQQSGFSSFNAPSTEPPASGMFSFGQKATAPAPATVQPAASAPFSFGGGSIQTPAPTQQSGFSFGQSNPIQPVATTAQTVPADIFSRLGDKQQEAKSFSFGGNSQAQPLSNNSNTPFGNANNIASVSTSSPFGSSGSSAFNQPQTSTNMFGNSQPTQNNDFNGNAKPSSGGMFSFGSSNNNQHQSPPHQQQQQQQVAQAPAGGMFSFGGQAAPTNNPPSLFGGNSGQNVSASFTFKPSTGVVAANSSPSVFGQNQNAASAPPPYQFGNQTGNSNNNNNSNVSASFTFGGASQNNPQAPSSGFNFNGPQTAPVAGTFNFQAPQPQLTPQPSSGGLFNIGTGGSQQQRRPMRQATRRMK